MAATVSGENLEPHRVTLSCGAIKWFQHVSTREICLQKIFLGNFMACHSQDLMALDRGVEEPAAEPQPTEAEAEKQAGVSMGEKLRQAGAPGVEGRAARRPFSAAARMISSVAGL